MTTNQPTIKQIQQRTADVCGVRLKDILSERRNQPVARARQIAMFAARLLTPHGTPTIGKAFHRDHTTVLYAINLLDHRVWLDAELRETIRTVCVDWAGDWGGGGPVLKEIGDWSARNV